MNVLGKDLKMQDKKQIVIDFVKRNGPVLPVQISKQIDTNIIFAGAIVSELVHNKAVLITNVKKGGSPFYYVKGQEHKLAQLGQYISGKEKEAFLLIQEKKILRDRALPPPIRVALRELKDFAVPLHVRLNGNEEIFWKWHMVGDEEASSGIKKIVGLKEDKKIVEEKPVEKESSEKDQVLTPVVEEKRKPTKKKKTSIDTEFYSKVMRYFNNNNIFVVSGEIVRKNKEFNYIVKVPSKIGNLAFYVKVKNKNSISDADLSLAYSEGQQRKLNVLFLSKGNLTKKAKEYLVKNLKGQLVFRNLEV